MIQFKLFEYFKSNDESIESISNINFSNTNDYYIFNNKYLGIAYDNKFNSYADILRKIKEIKSLRQVLITPSVFFNVLEQAVTKEYTIKDVKFISPVPHESLEFVNHYIDKLNSNSNDKNKILTELKSELDWLINDESIDIEKISLLVGNINDINPYVQLEIYNNGVFTVNSKSIPKDLSELVSIAF